MTIDKTEKKMPIDLINILIRLEVNEHYYQKNQCTHYYVYLMLQKW